MRMCRKHQTWREASCEYLMRMCRRGLTWRAHANVSCECAGNTGHGAHANVSCECAGNTGREQSYRDGHAQLTRGLKSFTAVEMHVVHENDQSDQQPSTITRAARRK
jgi:hypothetical protein